MQLSKVEKDVVRSMCNNNMSITAVARELNYQRGSIMYRVEKIKERTGLNPQRYYDLVKLEKAVGGMKG